MTARRTHRKPTRDEAIEACQRAEGAASVWRFIGSRLARGIAPDADDVVRRTIFASGSFYTEPRLTGLTEAQAYEAARAYVGQG